MKLFRILALGVALSLLAGLGAGCSGINASHSVSPATFLLPGLMQHTPAPAPAPAPEVAAQAPLIALAR